MNTIINDNFDSIVRASKFWLGYISDYTIVDDAIHMSNGISYNFTQNSANIYLSWNNTVAVTIAWNLKHLSKYFANLSSEKPTLGEQHTL